MDTALDLVYWATRWRQGIAWVLTLVGLSTVVMANWPGQPAAVRIGPSIIGLALACFYGFAVWRCRQRPIIAFTADQVQLWIGPPLPDDEVASVAIRHHVRGGWFLVVRRHHGRGGMSPIGWLRWEDRFAVRDELRRRYLREGVVFTDALE